MKYERVLLSLLCTLAFFLFSACSLSDGLDQKAPSRPTMRTDFDVLVTRDGQAVSDARTGLTTKSAVDADNGIATMDPDIPFGLVAIDSSTIGWFWIIIR